ncbi:carboxymuconolactone decarboxylase family protein [Thiohalophilus sp.]|uniref:carboxymuconolactone decarboxylase family protein n=1 Tax=Thiohalophilus sp. TaxID=3028392 RepID=UPI002ACDE2E7|nr:carboxymuconolactone decarboxylase family protein [Thiohalophilus sp.]MDZ7661125.1 carboxymuconolactone decarboxylase family protein [Thiohalophilus sp.]
MTQFTFHDENSAPQDALPTMKQAKQAFGFVPNLISGMANSPALAEGYLTLSGLYANSSLTPQEQQVALLAVSRYNGCDYCVAAHSMIADMAQVPPDAIAALRDDRPIDDPKLEALRRFTAKMVDKRGWLNEADIREFLDAGFEMQQVGDVILAVGMKTLSNYFNHIAQTPLDEAMSEFAWERPAT